MSTMRTYKLKIISKHPNFTNIALKYREAANWLSKVVFNRNKIDTSNFSSREFYGSVRSKFGLPSQLTCSLFRHVVSTYRSIKSNGHWNLAVYKKFVLPLCWKHNLYMRKDGISILGQKYEIAKRKVV